MQDQVNATPTPHKRLPWNKGKLTGPNRRYDPSLSGRSGRSFRSKAAFATFHVQPGHRQQASW